VTDILGWLASVDGRSDSLPSQDWNFPFEGPLHEVFPALHEAQNAWMSQVDSLAAPDRKTLVAYTRALDRVLLWGFYIIPQWYDGNQRLVSWDKFSRPAMPPKYGSAVNDTWWFDQAKAEALEKRKAEIGR